MDLLKDNIGKTYRSFLMASFGSALISSIYGIVDMAMVGNYHGPIGSAAMSVIAPVWNIIYSLGLLVGIGGSVLLGVEKGKNNTFKANRYFTSSIILCSFISLIIWLILIFLEKPLLILFGANDTLLPLCLEYLTLPLLTVPFFIFTNLIAAFMRNDNDPQIATYSIIGGGIFNVLGDYFFIFVLNMGIKGAGIATTMGVSLSTLIMCLHFFKKNNTLKLVKYDHFFKDFLQDTQEIVPNGFSAWIVDCAMGILTILFNNVIMTYLDTNALAVYGILVNISTLVQCCAYAIGQAAQPIISQNYGAKNTTRIRAIIKHCVVTSLIMGAVALGVMALFPKFWVNLFMNATSEVLTIAPSIIRIYALSFILLPFNIFSTYYFQSVMAAHTATLISILRGILISGLLIEFLPRLFSANMVWLAMPITELIIALIVIVLMVHSLAFIKENSLEDKNSL